MKKANSASIRARLLNFSQHEDLTFQFVVIRYLHERLLYRLSISEYVSKFFLKGGALLFAIEGMHIRPTIDIDFLGRQIKNDKETIRKAFQSICNIRYEDDCVFFDVENIIVTDITEDKEYSGVRLFIDAHFDTIRQRLQIDIGFGDIITPAPVNLIYPVLLNELESPKLKAYSIETVIAEKFQAMIALGVFNSRMKDFYDIYILLRNNAIEDSLLQEAITQTFKQRDTHYVENHELFSDSFYEDSKRILMWNAFLKKMKIRDNLNFKMVVNEITIRLKPFYKFDAI